MSRRARILLLMSGVACVWSVLPACVPEASVVEWDRLESEEIDKRLGEPSGGEIDLEDSELLDAIAERIPELTDAARVLAYMVKIINEFAEEQKSRVDGGGGTAARRSGPKVRGTRFFVSVACPGDWAEPELDFSHGTARVDSPLIRGDVIGFLSGGDLLVTFKACEAGDTTLDGEAPARIQIGGALLGLAAADPAERTGIALDARELNISVGTVGLGVVLAICDGFETCLERQNVAAEIGTPGGTYVVVLEVTSDYYAGTIDELTVTVRGAAGTAECVYRRRGEPPIECSAELGTME